MSSNTPRTDLAAIYTPIRGNYICAPGTGSYVGVEFARQLERELNEHIRLNKHLRFEANSNLEALHEAQRELKSACPDGYVVVPKEPTEAMWSAGRDPIHYRECGFPEELKGQWFREGDGQTKADTACQVWRAMWAAAEGEKKC